MTFALIVVFLLVLVFSSAKWMLGTFKYELC